MIQGYSAVFYKINVVFDNHLTKKKTKSRQNISDTPKRFRKAFTKQKLTAMF